MGKAARTPKVQVEEGERAPSAAAETEDVFHQFDIEFDAGPEPVFHGGELCTGNLRVCLKRQITINAIRIQFKGRACWQGSSFRTSGKVDKAEEEKIYFDKDFVLLERPPGHPEPGHFPWNANFTYSLPFECPLPKGCPTSYEGPQAFIRYFARATFSTDSNGGKPVEYVVKRCFNIISPPELHELVPPKAEAVHRAETISYGGCCCRGKMTAEVALSKRSYAPGESIIGTFGVHGRHAQKAMEQVEVRLVDRAQLAPDPMDEPIMMADANGATQENAAAPQGEVRGKRKVKKLCIIPPGKQVPARLCRGKAPICRTLAVRQLEKGAVVKTKGTVSRNDVFFIVVPPLPPSTITEKEVNLGGIEHPEHIQLPPDAQISKLLESPSTATLRIRKQPFIQVDYAVQVSIGPSLLVEVPIEIHPIALYANGIGYRPSPTGQLLVGEVDEKGKQLVHAPFTFEPLYPTYLQPPKPSGEKPVSHEVVHEITPMPNGVAELTKTVEVSELPDGSQIVHRKQEYVVVREYSPGEASSLEQAVPPAAAVIINAPTTHHEPVHETSRKESEEIFHHHHHEPAREEPEEVFHHHYHEPAHEAVADGPYEAPLISYDDQPAYNAELGAGSMMENEPHTAVEENNWFQQPQQPEGEEEEALTFDNHNHAAVVGEDHTEHIVEHHEHDQHLDNGHVHIVETTIDDEGGIIHRTTEDYQYEDDEHNLKVHIHKMTESTEHTSPAIASTPNGDGIEERDK